MKSKLKLLSLLGLSLSLLAITASADQLIGETDSWTLSIGGSGSTTTTGDSQSVFGADIDLGHTGHLILPVQGGIRQGFGYESLDGGKTLFSTKLYLDATALQYKKLDIFLGGNIGTTYGNTPMIWTGGPEGGLRLWLKENVAFIGRVEYPFDINNNRAEDLLRYFIGFQVKL
jgi:hypothetical protein